MYFILQIYTRNIQTLDQCSLRFCPCIPLMRHALHDPKPHSCWQRALHLRTAASTCVTKHVFKVTAAMQLHWLGVNNR